MYNFKSLQVVPSSNDMVDIILSKTQRKTPTVVHKGYQITRIRQFYMRKVKFTSANIHKKLSDILTQFPRLDDIHPFYADLMNVLYDKDHYKVALGQVANVRTLTDHLCRDYIRMLKYGNSLYQCKQLKRAALGRMCTLLKKLHGSLGYLEQVRQHLSRLPSINPLMRTLLISGFPNVGKSSFINKVTRADVEVQPYAFTTKSLFVGHTDYNYSTWQVIDTPGILDHALEDRNTIEMQAITALAHLHACVLYFMDLSGKCGYTINAQVNLFRNIKPLFVNKPLVIAINKSDLMRLDQLEADERQLVETMIKEAGPNSKVVQLSVLTDDGVGELKTAACDMLLTANLEVKQNKKVYDTIQNRLHVATPHCEALETSIPESVLLARQKKQEESESQDITMEGSDDEEDFDPKKWPGMIDDLEAEDDREYLGGAQPLYDFTEIVDGMNVADFIDPDIEKKLIALELEEEELIAQEAAEDAEREMPFAIGPEAKQAAKWIRETNSLKRFEHALKRTRSASNRPVNQQIQQRNDQAAARIGGVKRSRSEAPEEESGPTKRGRSTSRMAKRMRARTSTPSAKKEGLAGMVMHERVKNLSRVKARSLSKAAKRGESDRHIPTEMPRHLFSGKVNVKGKRDRR